VSLRRWLSTAGWGFFCASSWTWCIAMFLPVILLRDFGWPGFVVFAIPNVLGCAAFGYVLDTGRCGELVKRHRTAMRWFSIAAIAYQAYFVAFLANAALPPSQTPWMGVAAGGGVAAAALILSAAPAGAWPALAVGAYAISLATFAGLGVSELESIAWSGARSGSDLMWLAPVVLFGFLLCPYLDLTFHRARRESPSRHAFAIFAVTFTAMIFLTCAYRDRWATLAVVPLAHIAVQCLFTTAAHLRELGRLDAGPGGRRALGLLVALASLILALAAKRSGSPGAGEAIYLRFLVFYGLIFPAYVLLFLGPGRALSLSRRSLTAYAAAVLIALPVYEVGFVGGRPWLLAIPLAGLVAWKAMGIRKAPGIRH
jgi:hypothetical protein